MTESVTHRSVGPTYLHGTRRYLLERFPYFVVYRETEEKLQVIAIAHGKRKPGYWRRRVD
ncbi:MAG: hypothetical protein CMJ64_18930 [Planctomycetaceae bacterium]|nr:hypothetical protein [Planctomycetaceae bacterium]